MPQILKTEEPVFRRPQDVIREALEKHHPRIAVACSFQAENIVIIDMTLAIRPDAVLFAIDTGRLPDATFEIAERVREKYGCEIKWFFPKKEMVQHLIQTKGLYSFRRSVENRKECCGIRKVEPNGRAIAELGLKALITGRTRDSSVTRRHLPQVEFREDGLFGYNPIVHWSEQQVWDYLRMKELPHHTYYDQGYRQIGCEPCTGPVGPGEDPRAGRWRWEKEDSKECGIHIGGSGI